MHCRSEFWRGFDFRCLEFQYCVDGIYQDTDQLRVLLPLSFHRQQLVIDRRLPEPANRVLILTGRPGGQDSDGRFLSSAVTKSRGRRSHRFMLARPQCRAPAHR